MPTSFGDSLNSLKIGAIPDASFSTWRISLIEYLMSR
jgi:hypothetical protein